MFASAASGAGIGSESFLPPKSILAQRLTRSQSWPTSGRDRRVCRDINKYICVCACACVRMCVARMKYGLCSARWCRARPCLISHYSRNAKTSAIQSKMSTFWQNENPSCRAGLHDTVACQLCPQPGMVALQVVSTPFHIRGANAARLRPADDYPLEKTWDDFHHSAVTVSVCVCVCRPPGRHIWGRSVLQSNVSHQRHMSLSARVAVFMKPIHVPSQARP